MWNCLLQLFLGYLREALFAAVLSIEVLQGSLGFSRKQYCFQLHIRCHLFRRHFIANWFQSQCKQHTLLRHLQQDIRNGVKWVMRWVVEKLQCWKVIMSIIKWKYFCYIFQQWKLQGGSPRFTTGIALNFPGFINIIHFFQANVLLKFPAVSIRVFFWWIQYLCLPFLLRWPNRHHLSTYT